MAKKTTETTDDAVARFEERLDKLELETRLRWEQQQKDNQLVITSLTELKLGVCGSEKIGVEGMVQRFNRHEIFIQHMEVENVVQKTNNHETYIEKDKKQKYKVVGGAMVVIFILGWLKDWIIGIFKVG